MRATVPQSLGCVAAVEKIEDGIAAAGVEYFLMLLGYSGFIKTVAIRAGFFCRKRTQRSQKALGWIFIL